MRTIKKLLDLLPPPERKRVYLLLFMILVMAVPANPDLTETNAFLNAAFA